MTAGSTEQRAGRQAEAGEDAAGKLSNTAEPRPRRRGQAGILLDFGQKCLRIGMQRVISPDDE
jgi:hypothetical protein